MWSASSAAGPATRTQAGRAESGQGRYCWERSPRNLLQKHCERSSKGSRGGRLTRLRHAHHQAGQYTTLADATVRGAAMLHVRFNFLTADPLRLGDSVKFIESEVRPQVDSQPGSLGT